MRANYAGISSGKKFSFTLKKFSQDNIGFCKPSV